MATDATGTPTTKFSIPKFNTAVDAPSGLGSNAQMDVIDAALANLGISTIVNNDVPVWDSGGAKWKKTTGTPSITTFLRGDGSWNALIPNLFITSGTQTNPVTGVTATTFGTSAAILGTDLAWTPDGTSNYLAVFSFTNWANNSALSNNVLGLSFDGTEYNRTLENMTTANALYGPKFWATIITTPSAVSHTVNWRMYVGSGTATINSGATHIAGGYSPIFGGIVKI